MQTISFNYIEMFESVCDVCKLNAMPREDQRVLDLLSHLMCVLKMVLMVSGRSESPHNS